MAHPARRLPASALVLFGALAGCGRACSRADGGPAAAAAPAPDPAEDSEGGFVGAAAALGSATASSGPLHVLTSPPEAGRVVDVPGGTFPSGSTPGDEGRDPAVEPALVDVTMTPFSIDALPFPNDPGAAPRTGVSRDEAARLCAERGARLCTELEWERACKGSDNDAFSTGPAWNAECDRSPSRCASGFGVFAMGFLREWTDGAIDEGSLALRGGAGTLRRCAARARARVTPGAVDASLADVGFRCCRGARNAAGVPSIEPLPAFRRTTIDAQRLAAMFEEVPELERVGKDVRLFSDPDVKSVLNRSGASHAGITFATSPILWSPEIGVELLVATGRSKSLSFVVALWPLPGGRARFASSFLLLNEVAPVVLAYEPSRRKELRWTTCWGCAGEQGAVSYRDDGRVVIVQY